MPVQICMFDLFHHNTRLAATTLQLSIFSAISIYYLDLPAGYCTIIWLNIKRQGVCVHEQRLFTNQATRSMVDFSFTLIGHENFDKGHFTFPTPFKLFSSFFYISRQNTSTRKWVVSMVIYGGWYHDKLTCAVLCSPGSSRFEAFHGCTSRNWVSCSQGMREAKSSEMMNKNCKN